MFYEEKIIKGVLCRRYSQSEEFKPFTPEELTQKLTNTQSLVQEANEFQARSLINKAIAKLVQYDDAPLPNYVDDLNAVATAVDEAFGYLSNEWVAYGSKLLTLHAIKMEDSQDIMEDDGFIIASIAGASALTKCEALLRVSGQMNSELRKAFTTLNKNRRNSRG